MPIIERASGALDLFEDVGSLRGPEEGLGALVVFVDVFSDSRNRFFGIVKDAATQTILCEVPEEALHPVQPRTAGRREVDVEPGMTSRPSPHFGMFVRGIVADNRVEIFFRRRDPIDYAQELQSLPMAVAVVAPADHRAIESVHRGKQSGSPVPFVIVGHGPATAFLDR